MLAKYHPPNPYGWMFELFIDAQPQKGIKRLNDYKNTMLHYKLVWKKTKEIQD